MNVPQLFKEATEAIGSAEVFAEPYEKNGVTVIPAARITGGGGGAEGPVAKSGAGTDALDEAGPPSGSGAGFGVSGQPMGAFVIKGDNVRWMPAVDVNRLMFGFQVVLIVLFLAMRSIAKSRAEASRFRSMQAAA